MNQNLRFNSPGENPAASQTNVPEGWPSPEKAGSVRKGKALFLSRPVRHFLYFCSIVFFSVSALNVNAQLKAVQWNGLNGSSYSDTISRLYGDITAKKFRTSTNWFGTATSNLAITDNYMANAGVTPIGNRNTWASIARTSGIGAAYSDSGFVEFKVSPSGSSPFNVTLVQLSVIMNSRTGDFAGRLAAYYSVDNNDSSFANRMNLGMATLQLINGSTQTFSSTIADPIPLQNHANISQQRNSPHTGDYSFSPNIMVNPGQTLTIRFYAWNPNEADRYLNIRNIAISNTSTWPNQQVVTAPITAIMPRSAVAGGIILSDGGFPLSESGFVWTSATNIIPSRNERAGIFLTNPVKTSGAYSGPMTGLTPATTYYVRSFATNANGTAYGQLESFTTADSIVAKPTVTTTAPSGVASATAVTGGNITSNGGGSIMSSGVLYSTTLSTESTLIVGSGASMTMENAKSGSYVSNLTGLTAGTKYYVRAYASNADSTGYGAVDSFTTSLVGITTAPATNISSTAATSGGTITPNSGGTITASGVVASAIPNPEVTTPGAIITNEDSTSGSYASMLTGLMPSTTYYVRAYATIGGVTTYGNQQTFSTSVTPMVVQWNGLNGGSYTDTISRLYGNITAEKFRTSTSWVGTGTSNLALTDNYMANAAETPRGNRNNWASIARTSGIGAAYSDSGFVEFKVSPTDGNSFNARLVQFSVIMNSAAGDFAGRLAVYYSVDSSTTAFANPTNLGTATLKLITGATQTSGSTIANPIQLQNHANISQLRNSTHTGDYSFSPNIMVNSGQTLTLRLYGWNAANPDKYLNIRNVVIANTDTWPNQKLTTAAVTGITPTSAVGGGNIITDGGFALNESGFAWTSRTNIAPSRNERDGLFMTSPVVTSGPFNGTMTGLTPATTYYVRAYANNANGAAYGQLVSFTTADSITGKPVVTTATPTNVGSSGATSGGNITSNGGGMIVGSGVIYSTSLSSNSTLVLGSNAVMTAENVPAGSYASTLTGLAAGTKYYVRAYASNSDSTGYGAIDSFVTKLVDITTAPVTNVASTTATAGGTITPNPINGGPISASGVIVSTSPDPDLNTGGAMIITGNTTSGPYSSDLTGLTPSTTYYVVAYATINGVTTYGTTVSFTTGQILPMKLISFTALPFNDAVIVRWTTAAEQNLKGFVVERSRNGSGFTAVSGLVAPGSVAYSFTDNTVTTGGYYYRLKTTDIDGTVSYSNIVYVSFDITKLNMSVYPNPASGTINLSHPAAVHGSTVRIVSLNGRVVLSTTLKTGNTLTNLNIAKLPAGAYMIVLDDHRSVLTIKFVKN